MKHIIHSLLLVGAVSTFTVTAAEPDTPDRTRPADGTYNNNNNDPNRRGTDVLRDSRSGNADNPRDLQQSPQKFVEAAYLSGLKEIHMSQLAATRAEKSEVKNFAQQMIQDHTKLNEQLSQLAQRKGWNLPDTNYWQGTDNQTSQSGSPSLQPNGADAPRGTRDSIATDRRTTEINNPGNVVRDRRINGSEREAGTGSDVRTRQDGTEQGGRAHMQGKMSIDSLKNATAGEFDKIYMRESVRGHQMSVKKFEHASQNTSDEEVRTLARETLPKLRDHLQQATQLAQTVGAQVDQDKDWKDDKRGTDQRRQKP